MGNAVTTISCGLIKKQNSTNQIVASSLCTDLTSNNVITPRRQRNKRQKKFKKEIEKTRVERIIDDIKTIFYIDDTDINNLKNFYINKLITDESKKFLFKYDLYVLCKVTSDSDEICPYIEHFWENIYKKKDDRAEFHEFVAFLLSYCICSNYQLIEFVFGLIDKDGDGHVAHEEIINLVSKKVNGKEIFRYNHLEQIKQYTSDEIRRKDMLTKDEFLTTCLDNPFIFYPAVKLQNLLKKYYINKKFWKILNEKVTKNYTESIANKEHRQLQVNIEQIRNKVINERIKEYRERWKKEEEDERKKLIYKEPLRIWLKVKSNTDTLFLVDKIKLANDINRYKFFKKEKNLKSFLNYSTKFKEQGNKKQESRQEMILRKLKKVHSTINIDIFNGKYENFYKE